MGTEKTKRDLILDAAAVVFAQHGFHNAKMEEIAVLAGVGKGTLYEYFSSKQQLFQELIVIGVEKFINQINTDVAKCSSAEDKLRKIALLHCYHVINFRDLTRVTMDGHGQLSSDFRRWICEIQTKKTQMIKQIIEEGIASGEFRPDLNSQAGSLVFSGAMTSVFHIAVFNAQLDEAALIQQVREITDVIFKGLQKDG